jgi:uncharacterized protein (TIGR03067 family)
MEPSMNDITAIQGCWTVVSFERRGNVDLESPCNDYLIQFRGDTFRIAMRDYVAFVGSYALNTTKPPREIDMRLSEAHGEECSLEWWGIYELEANTLKWCMVQSCRDDRPRAFRTRADQNDYLFTLCKANPS